MLRIRLNSIIPKSSGMITRIAARARWLLLIILPGCTEIIDLHLPSEPPRLVVDAIITNDAVPQVVKLSRSVPYFNGEAAPAVTSARVTISDGSREFIMTESTEHPGYYYLLPHQFRAAPGKTYYLFIDGVDLSGSGQYQSFTARATMPEIVPAQMIGLLKDEPREIWQVFVWFNDPAGENFYMFRISVNNNLLTRRPTTTRVFNDLFFDGNLVRGLWVQSISSGSESRGLKTGDVVTLELCSISPEHYLFLEAIQNEASYATPFFGGPPANVPGNISNGGLGFFGAMAVSRASVVY